MASVRRDRSQRRRIAGRHNAREGQGCSKPSFAGCSAPFARVAIDAAAWRPFSRLPPFRHGVSRAADRCVRRSNCSISERRYLCDDASRTSLLASSTASRSIAELRRADRRRRSAGFSGSSLSAAAGEHGVPVTLFMVVDAMLNSWLWFDQLHYLTAHGACGRISDADRQYVAQVRARGRPLARRCLGSARGSLPGTAGRRT